MMVSLISARGAQPVWKIIGERFFTVSIMSVRKGPRDNLFLVYNVIFSGLKRGVNKEIKK